MLPLSEAIRLGACLHPQAFGTLYEHDASGSVIATCALGAAERAGYDIVPLTRLKFLCEGSQLVLEPMRRCPQWYGCGDFNLGALIAHLNDAHQWTREKIADYVEQIEEEEEKKDPRVERGATLRATGTTA